MSQSHPQFHNKVISITGAASGIGHATAKELASRGAHLALADLNLAALETAASTLRSSHPTLQITTHEVDVSNSASVNTWIDAVIAHHGQLDGSCNIAGVDGPPGGQHPYVDITDMTDSHWQFVQDVNLTGTFYCVRAQLRVMKRGASVVNAASTAGLRGAARFAAYTASKHGVVGLTKSAAKDAGPKGIRVNAVCPGPIDTPLLRRMAWDDQEFWKKLEDASALKGMGKLEDVARTFCYLLGEDSGWVTGTTVTLDGGAS